MSGLELCMAPGNMSEALPLESRWDRSKGGFAALVIIGLVLGAALVTMTLRIMALLPPARTNDKAAIERMLREIALTHGIDPKAFYRTAQIESRLDPLAYHPRSKAAGIFQVTPPTARRYGLVQVFDPKANAEAAAALWLHNATVLRRMLGREPSVGEIYLAHQQGAKGAVRLLKNPKAQAIKLVGRKAVIMNGGTARMTAGTFSNLWIRRFRSLD
jgi:hypothetical protein